MQHGFSWLLTRILYSHDEPGLRSIASCHLLNAIAGIWLWLKMRRSRNRGSNDKIDIGTNDIKEMKREASFAAVYLDATKL